MDVLFLRPRVPPPVPGSRSPASSHERVILADKALTMHRERRESLLERLLHAQPAPGAHPEPGAARTRQQNNPLM